MRHRAALSFVAFLMLAAMACNLPGAANGATATPTVTPTPGDGVPTATPGRDGDEPESDGTPPAEPTDEVAPTQTPTITVAVPTSEPPVTGSRLYDTDFTSGWSNILIPEEDPQGAARVTSDGYEFEVARAWGHWVFSTRVDVSAFYAEVRARPLECPVSDGGYGMMFHYENNDNLRSVLVTCNNRYQIRERRGGTTATIASGNLPGGLDVATGEHVVGVSARDDKLALYVDGVRVDEVEIDGMPQGDVGPYVSTANSALKVLFTQLTVYQQE